ncbi:MAG TPA: alcohol dehydrogenase catalytic domain-containing protein [Solirubrobacterales bacterium]|nr:alcohol dehydrogenase catalytic domain-containing protein [Solirubrobacterales bacterium]
MQQLDFIEKGRLEWREASAPRLEAEGEALVRPLAVATCDLDLLLVRGLAPVEEPFPFGHECVAEVIDVGDGVQGVEPGDLVSVPFQISCGECDACRRGNTGNCERVERMAMYGLPMGTNYGGFLSDSVRVPFADAMLVPVPDGIDPASIASLSDNIPDAWRTVGPQLAERPGVAVLICASGAAIALYATSIALALGAERVDFAGGNSYLRGRAEELGANLLEADFPKRYGPYPITVDASADPDGLACALRSTEPDGICTSIGIYFSESTPVPLLEMYTKGIRFHTGRCHARPAMEPLMDLVRAGDFKPQRVTAETAAWDDAPEAIAAHRSKLVISRPA